MNLPGSVVPIYAFGYFTPTIVKAMGYSPVQTQLHSVPPYAAALGLCLVQAYLVDRTNLRLPYLLFCGALLIAGMAILMTTYGHLAAQYAGLCLVSMGSLCAAPLLICWYLMNLDGHKQRSMGSAWMISVGNSGGIVATFAFPNSEAPRNRPGYATCMAVSVLGVVMALAYGLIVLQVRRRTSVSQGGSSAASVPAL